MRMGFYSTLVVSLCILLYSCENDQRGGSDDKRIPYPEGKEIPVRLEIGPSLETEVQPLSRAVNDKGLYAVNVFWKGKGINAYQPYASGLFDDISNITIGLIEGYKYRFDCSFLRNDELPYQRVVNDTAYYGLPFALKSGNNSVTEAAVTNKLKVSINPLNENYTFHQYIYEGKKQLDVNRISNYPTGKRFYGSCEFDFTVNDGQDCRIAMELCRSYYSLKFVSGELYRGDSVKIQIEGIDPLYLIYSPEGQAESEIIILSLSKTASVYSGVLETADYLPVTVQYRSALAEQWHLVLDRQLVKMIRNKNNVVKLVNIDREPAGWGHPEFSFEGGSSDGLPEEELQQELGNNQ